MFDFQKLDIYKKSKTFYIDCKNILSETKLENYVKDQLSRAAFSVPLNIAEGSGKFSKADRKNYFTTSRASLHECVAVLDILHDEKKIDTKLYQKLLVEADEISRILFTMIKNLTN